MSTVTHARVARHVRYVAELGVDHRASWHYTQSPRRWQGINERVLSPSTPTHSDCSSGIAWLFWDARVHIRGKAGQDILNGLNWKAGNTDSMIRHGTRHQHGPEYWIPGRTCIFYGGPRDGSDPTHVSLWMGDVRGYGANQCWTMGSEPGPFITDWDYRSDWRQARAYRI